MKIIEGLKKLRILEKRMQSNNMDIQKYSAIVSTEKPNFNTEDEQRKEVMSRIQANLDLVHEHLTLKKRLEKTNLETQVTIQGKTYTISELLVLRRGLGKHVIQTYTSLNESGATMRLRNAVKIDGQPAPHVVRMYDERTKNEQLRAWSDFFDEIDSKLEVVNATEDLKEL